MEGFPNWPPSWSVLLFVPALLIGFTVHELAHAVVAFLLGDTSQVERNRLTFNPLRHVSWLGMVVFLLLGFGWAKPVQVDSSRFQIKNRAFGLFLVSVAGPSANLLLFLVAALGISGTVMIVSVLSGAEFWDVFMYFAEPNPVWDLQGVVVALTSYLLYVNLILAVFNLLPIPPLDGFQAVMSLVAAVRGGREGIKVPRPASWPTLSPAPGTSDSRPSPPQGRGPRLRGEDAPVLSPAQIHFNIGLEYHKDGLYDEAIARYRQATAHDEEFALAYYNQGLAYLAKDRGPLAASAFRAAMHSSRDAGLRLQADHRLRELARVEQEPSLEPTSVPPPLEPGSEAEVAGGARPLDAAVVRGVWLRLGVGMGLMLILAGLVWLFVVSVTFQAMM